MMDVRLNLKYQIIDGVSLQVLILGNVLNPFKHLDFFRDTICSEGCISEIFVKIFWNWLVQSPFDGNWFLTCMGDKAN